MNLAENVLSQLFNENRAEWPQEDFKKLFVEPTYLRKLESIRPCVLIGGRGTGKTTCLQSLKYDSTLERLESNGLNFGDQEYLGILTRMNKNRVKVFEGSQLPDESWRKLFAHFFNLLVCKELILMTLWLESKSELNLSSDDVNIIANDLGLSGVSTLSNLSISIRQAISDIQIYVNNPTSCPEPRLSIAESPLRTFSEVLRDSGLLNGRVIFCCIDEYENLSDNQQAILNTYIKHAEPPLSYKIGVRKNGFRNRQTLNEQDMLAVPDDYAEIEIIDEGFEYFATAVAELRLKYAIDKGVNVPAKLKHFLKGYSFAEEAKKLGAEKVADKVLQSLEMSGATDLVNFFKNKSKSETYFLEYWRERDNSNLVDLAKNWKKTPQTWKLRIENHGYASLFWISRGNKGQRIRKYYCGERVLLALAGGNIRYFLELINDSINFEIGNQLEQSIDKIVLSQQSQTLAARKVGKNRLNQLEGFADNGVLLKRLVLAIGKVFFEFARTPENRAPEINSFVLTGTNTDKETLVNLLNEGVGHLAFEAEPRTKATSSYELRDDEYRLHRIFTGFFEISHRKKRRTTFDAADMLDVLKSKPSIAISKLVERQDDNSDESNKKVTRVAIEDLPEQLAFFSTFYEESDTDGCE
jgi:hypothetical protein